MSMQPQSGNPAEDIRDPGRLNQIPDTVPDQEAPGRTQPEPDQAPPLVPGKPAPGQDEPGRQPTPGDPGRKPHPAA